MDILEQVVESLTSDEVRRFKILSNRFKADEEKKLLILFDAIRAGGYVSIEGDVIIQFYGNDDAKARNNYYRLRNKLLSNVEKSLLFYHFNYKNTLESLNNIQLSMLLMERGLYRETFHYLRKAEKIALENDQFNILEVIYDNMIQLAAKDIEVEIADIIKRRKDNFKKIQITRSHSEVLGSIIQELKKTNFSRSRKSDHLVDILEDTRKKLEEHQHIFHSANGRIMIIRAVGAMLIQKGAFIELEKYIKDNLVEFEQKNWFNKENHTTQIIMHIWRINALRKLMRLEEEAEQIEELIQHLEAFKKQNYKEYVIYYYSSKINNLKLLGKLQESGEVLQEAFKQTDILSLGLNELYLLISQADQYFCQELYINALDTLKKIQQHPKYGKLTEEIRFYLKIFEMTCNYEARNYGQATDSYEKIKKEFKTLYKDADYKHAQEFVEILLRLVEAAIHQRKVFIRSAYSHYVETYPQSEIAGNQVIMYELYLQAKLEDTNYYPLMIEKLTPSAIKKKK